MNTTRKLALLSTLYLSQGLPFGFFSDALAAVMRSEGASLHAIANAKWLALPWLLKFLWAPLVDRWGSRRFGRRRSWIVPMQLAAVLLLCALALLRPTHVSPLVLAFVFLTNLVAATQDIATDALAVETLSAEERGLGNAIQVAGYRVGMIIGGGALLVVFANAGYTATLLAMAAVLALATVPVLAFREPEAAAAHATAEPSSVGDIRATLATPGLAGWLAVLVLYKAGDALAVGMVKPFLVDAGLGLAQVGWISGALGSTAGMIGSLVGGLGVGWLGRRRAMVAFGLFQAAGVGLYVIPARGAKSLGVIAAICAIEHLAGGMGTVALFTLMMDRCRPGRAGTDYTLQASIVVFATGIASWLGGFTATALGWPAHFALATALAVLGVLLVASRGEATSGDVARPAHGGAL